MNGLVASAASAYPRRRARPALRMIGYARAADDEQSADMDAQVALIHGALTGRPDWELVVVEREQASCGDAEWPVLERQLARIRRREADGLVVARLDRVTRSLSHLAVVLDDAYTGRWVLVALDVAMDLSTRAGQMGVASHLRRRLISQNTRAALAVKRAQGVRLGRPRQCPDEVLARIVAYRATGARLVDICEQLNVDGVLTPAGSTRWYPSHVSRLLRTQDAVNLASSDLCGCERAPKRRQP